MPERYLGRSLGKYRVSKVIGAGAYAWVYEARDTDLEIQVALKVLRPEFAGNVLVEARFRREATTAARLRHPHIVTVRDVGQADGTTFVAMDLLPSTLGRRLDVTGRIPEDEVVRLGLDVATALAAAHSAGVVHRDIKPDNILIGEHGEGVVGDFGLARAIEVEVSATGSGIVVGTPQFFSPEQARGIDLDGRSDLYALGVTLFRAATGVLPFDGGDWYSIARQHVEEPPPRPRALAPELTEAFEQVVLRLLAKAPEDRYADAGELATALQALPTAPSNAPTRELRVLPALLTTERKLPAAETLEAPRFPAVRAVLTAERVMEAGGPPRWLMALLTIGLFALVGGGFAWLRVRRANGPAELAVVALAPTDSTVDSTRRDDPPPLVGAPDSVIATNPRPLPPPPAVNPFLVPAPSKGGLDVRAPQAAELFVGTRAVGNGAWRADTMTPGRYLVRALVPTLENCASADVTREIRVRQGQREQVVFDVRPCGALSLESTPTEARYTIDEPATRAHFEGALPLTSRLVLPAGSYTLVIQRPGCAEYRTSVRISADIESLRERATLLCN